ncbi:ABC transporter permease [Candidatus Solirubrobacter pratensis]|uniref:ABC transporter permease n=1 Tax=Candidatus Solirubrobacter pratensis TaxID=1298857 RepID=UPI00041ACA6B|nr:ABC transporter permease [Candidatus Solirubrobacter pratensis]
MLSDALAGLRARRSRTMLAAAGVFAAALVAGTATTVGYSLATGFDRSADRADLPDVIARFSSDRLSRVDARVSALPNLAARSYRWERTNVALDSAAKSTGQGALDLVLGGRRGYLVVSGHDLTGAPGEVVVERGLAQEWGLKAGDDLRVGRLGWLRIAGIAVSPDNVAYPLAKAARVYVSPEWLGFRPDPNVALLWLNDPSKADVTLTQARAVSFGLGRLQFITRDGVRVLLSQAAGIVISLLIAFSLVALVAAGTMLAAGAHADVQRRLPALGVQRALGFTPARIAALQATEAALVAIPAAGLGIAAGAALVARPAGDLLAALNELSPGWALVPPLAVCLLAVTLVVVTAATWPAWKAARRPPVEILRGGDVAVPARRRRAATRGGGLAALGARFATAARGRWVAAVATIAVCAGVVTLMLALASLLERLRTDPGTVGKRYQLSLTLDSSRVGEAAKVPGVAAVGRRYSVDAADSFRLGEPVRLVAYPGDHTRFEAPPLAEGRRIRGAGDIEVGQGMADALGLSPGSVFAAQLPNGEEARFRVSGVVRALENDGRIAWVRAGRLLAADPAVSPEIVVRVRAGANRDAVVRRLEALGAQLTPVGGAQTDDARFLAVLAAVLRGVGLAVGLVCLYALIQALTVTARERRGAVALLRACGADAATVALVLAGAAAAVAIPAALAGVLLGTFAFGPLVARLAAGFASLPLAPTGGQVALVVAGLLALAAAATAIVARRVLREPIVAGLREE